MPRLLVNIDVDDRPRAIAFYRDALDLRVGRRFGSHGVELLGANAPVYLLHKPAGTPGGGVQPRRYGRHWTPVHLDFVVEDIAAALTRALAAGARQEGEVRRAVWGWLVTCVDPFGHGFCLVQFNGRRQGEVGSGE